jgi:hypothetical protein
MTNAQRQRVVDLFDEGTTFEKISALVRVPKDDVVAVCLRHRRGRITPDILELQHHAKKQRLAEIRKLEGDLFAAIDKLHLYEAHYMDELTNKQLRIVNELQRQYAAFLLE